MEFVIGEACCTTASEAGRRGPTCANMSRTLVSPPEVRDPDSACHACGQRRSWRKGTGAFGACLANCEGHERCAATYGGCGATAQAVTRPLRPCGRGGLRGLRRPLLLLQCQAREVCGARGRRVSATERQ